MYMAIYSLVYALLKFTIRMQSMKPTSYEHICYVHVYSNNYGIRLQIISIHIYLYKYQQPAPMLPCNLISAYIYRYTNLA